MNRRHCVYTLIELLVTISIISIMAAMLLPALSRAREKGQRGLCLSNLKQQALAFKMYSDEFDQHFPDGMAWQDVTYTSGKEPFPGTTNEWNGNYPWNVDLAKYMDHSVTICPADEAPANMSMVNGSPGATLNTYRPFFVRRFGSDPITSSPPASYADASSKWPMSYVSNVYLGPFYTQNYNGINQDDNVVHPDKCIVLTEQGGDANGVGVFHTFFGFDAGTRWHNGRRHYKERGRNFSFVDGHAEHWRDPTYSTLPGDIRPAYADIGLTDLPAE